MFIRSPRAVSIQLIARANIKMSGICDKSLCQDMDVSEQTSLFLYIWLINVNCTTIDTKPEHVSIVIPWRYRSVTIGNVRCELSKHVITPFTSHAYANLCTPSPVERRHLGHAKKRSCQKEKQKTCILLILYWVRKVLQRFSKLLTFQTAFIKNVLQYFWDSVYLLSQQTTKHDILGNYY